MSAYSNAKGIVNSITVRVAIVTAALSLQFLSVGFSILGGIDTAPFTVFSILTIIILLDGLRVTAERRPSIEELVEERVWERTNTLAAQMTEFERRASTDAMTGLLNRRGGEAVISCHVLRSKSFGNPLSFLLLDIDHFKKINDGHGHAIGDEVLVAVAKCLKENVRTADEAIRWGGEEFLVTLPDTDLKGAMCTAEKLREMVSEVVHPQVRVTVSIGCAELGQDDFQVALARADMNLYFAKSKGRNRIFPEFDQNMLDR